MSKHKSSRGGGRGKDRQKRTRSPKQPREGGPGKERGNIFSRLGAIDSSQGTSTTAAAATSDAANRRSRNQDKERRVAITNGKSSSSGVGGEARERWRPPPPPSAGDAADSGASSRHNSVDLSSSKDGVGSKRKKNGADSKQDEIKPEKSKSSKRKKEDDNKQDEMDFEMEAGEIIEDVKSIKFKPDTSVRRHEPSVKSSIRDKRKLTDTNRRDEALTRKQERSSRRPSRSIERSSRRGKSPTRRDRSLTRRDEPRSRRNKSPSRRDKSPNQRRDKSPSRRDEPRSRRDSSSRRGKSPSRRDKSPSRRDESSSRRDEPHSSRDESSRRRGGRSASRRNDMSSSRRHDERASRSHGRSTRRRRERSALSIERSQGNEKSRRSDIPSASAKRSTRRAGGRSARRHAEKERKSDRNSASDTMTNGVKGRDNNSEQLSDIEVNGQSDELSNKKSEIDEKEKEEEEEEEEEEDEDAQIAKILEEKRKKRAAILAKHQKTEEEERNKNNVTILDDKSPSTAETESESTNNATGSTLATQSSMSSEKEVDMENEKENTTKSTAAEAAIEEEEVALEEMTEKSQTVTQAGTSTNHQQPVAVPEPPAPVVFNMFASDLSTETAKVLPNKSNSSGQQQLRAKGLPTTNSPAVQTITARANTALMDNWDDAEGYYHVRVGEVLDGRYLVCGSHGKGMFSSVLNCQDQLKDGVKVAIKVVRNNDTMRRLCKKELLLLEEISQADPENKRHVIRVLRSFEHLSHPCMVFEHMDHNLREVLDKYGKGVGINLQGVQHFARQLLVALHHLEKLGIVHADLKPDNILVDAHNRLKVCDLGSAFRRTDPENQPTPYLISRFYRAPEVILGLKHDTTIDLWSAACCLYELHAGKILFAGRTNNQMLKLIMDRKGRFSNKLVKRHLQAYELLEKPTHFEPEDLRFRFHDSDEVTGAPVLRLLSIPDNPTSPSVKAMMMQSYSVSKAAAVAAGNKYQDKRMVAQLGGLLERMLALTPQKRISLKDALAHPFIAVVKEQEEQQVDIRK